MGCLSSKESSPPGGRKTSSTQTNHAEINPSLKPPKRKRCKLITDPTVFKDTDNRARRAPATVATSVQSLASYLTSQCHEDIHKVRAIFCWLAANITYDTRSKSSGPRRPQDAESVLRSRMAVCQGYAELCLALCNAVSVPCLLVQGFAKGVDHDFDSVYKEDTEINHAWNLVQIQGEWRPLDCTWGAGSMERGGNFKREFTEHWFLTDPEDFLPTHFPYMDSDLASSRQYQLVSRPIDLQQFSATVKPENAALKVGLQFLTHTRTVINVKNDVTVKVKVKSGRSPLESVTAYLAPPDSPNKEDRSGVVTSLKDDGTCSVYVRPPANGKYLLVIMGRSQEQAGTTLYQFVTYVIECHRQKPVQHPFPDKSGMWGRLYPMATECGLKKTKNAPVQFETRTGQVTVPIPLAKAGVTVQPELYHALNMRTDLARYTMTEYTEDGAIITARLPRAGYYLLRVFASHPDSAKTLQQAADLLLYSSKDIKDCPQFPQAYTFAHTHKVRLLQPQSSTVAQGVKTVYRIHAPTLAKVKVAGTEMTLKRNAWEAEVTPKPGDREISIYGAIDKQARTLNGLYKFEVSS